MYRNCGDTYISLPGSTSVNPPPAIEFDAILREPCRNWCQNVRDLLHPIIEGRQLLMDLRDRGLHAPTLAGDFLNFLAPTIARTSRPPARPASRSPANRLTGEPPDPFNEQFLAGDQLGQFVFGLRSLGVPLHPLLQQHKRRKILIVEPHGYIGEVRGQTRWSGQLAGLLLESPDDLINGCALVRLIRIKSIEQTGEPIRLVESPVPYGLGSQTNEGRLQRVPKRDRVVVLRPETEDFHADIRRRYVVSRVVCLTRHAKEPTIGVSSRETPRNARHRSRSNLNVAPGEQVEQDRTTLFFGVCGGPEEVVTRRRREKIDRKVNRGNSPVNQEGSDLYGGIPPSGAHCVRLRRRMRPYGR